METMRHTFKSEKKALEFCLTNRDYMLDKEYDPSSHCDYACLRVGCRGSCDEYAVKLKPAQRELNLEV